MSFQWTGRAWGFAAALTLLLSLSPVLGHFVAVGNQEVRTSDDGSSWQDPFFEPNTGSLLSATFAAGHWVAVGSQTLTSGDGIHWDAQPNPLASPFLYGVVGTGLRLVAVAGELKSGPNLYTSSDGGTTWTPVATSFGNLPLRAVTDGNGTLVAVGLNGAVLRSTDLGATWSLQSSGVADDLAAVAFGQGKFVAAGAHGTILASGDGGISWAQQCVGCTTQDLKAVAFGNGLWVAGGMCGFNEKGVCLSQGPYLLASKDAAAWVPQTLNPTPSLKGVAYGGGRWVAVGDRGEMFTSADGLTWAAGLDGMAYSNNLEAVAYHPGQWLAVGENSGAKSILLTSPDGVQWQPRSSAALAGGFGGIGFDGSQWLASESYPDGEFVLSSPDRMNWTVLSQPPIYPFGTPRSGDIAYGDGQWMMVGNALDLGPQKGRIVGSTDGGRTWTVRQDGGGLTWTTVAYDAGEWVATTGAIVATSPDGYSWSIVCGSGTPCFSGMGQSLNALAHGQDLWVSAGNPAVQGSNASNSTVLVSPDGASWQTLALHAPDGYYPYLKGLKDRHGTWLAVGPGRCSFIACAPARFFYSHDALNWSAASALVPSGPLVFGTNSAVSTSLNDVAYQDGTWVAVGNFAFQAKATDLQDWTQTMDGPLPWDLTHVAAEPDPLRCTPARQTVALGAPATLMATGGFWHYTWTAPDGSMAPLTGDLVGGVFTTPGIHTVVLTDSARPPQSVQCTVVVMDPNAPPLACAAEHGAILRGQPDRLTASGGNGDYTWSAPDSLSLHAQATAATVTYGHWGAFDVTVHDESVPQESAVCTVQVPSPDHTPSPQAAAQASPRAPTCADSDADGICDAADNCPGVVNADQEKPTNPVGDACLAMRPAATERRPKPGTLGLSDTDQDGITDVADNCPTVPNVDQTDVDGDGVGDACDTDIDGDGIPNAGPSGAWLDDCPFLPNADQTDRNGDGVGDACQALPGRHAQPAVHPAATVHAAPTTSAAWIPAFAAAVATILWAASRWFLGPAVIVLFSRLRESDLALHPVRRAILDVLAANPGLQASELARLVGKGRGTVAHHLKVLCAAGLVHRRRWEGVHVHFVAGHPSDALPIPAVRGPHAQALLDLAREAPGVSLMQAVRRLGLSEHTVRYHAARLEKAGLVRLRREGHRIALSPAPVPAAPSPRRVSPGTNAA